MATGAMSDFENYLSKRADSYFKRTREIVRGHGDRDVTYAVFMRRPVVFCPRLAVDWLEHAANERSTHFSIERCFEEGERVGAGEVLLYVSGQMSHLVDLETIYLQRLGAPCVAAYNAYQMCVDLPRVRFLAIRQSVAAHRESEHRFRDWSPDAVRFGCASETRPHV